MVVRAMLAAQLCIPRIGYKRPPTSLLHSRRVLCSAAASSQLPPVLYYNDHYEVPLPPTHRFPMQKYREVRLALQRELEHRGVAHFQPSPLATLDELTTTHTAEYVARYLNGELTEKENRRVGFPWSIASVNRSLSSTGGTVAAARAVCTRPGLLRAGHLAGGTHHAFADRGEGFCVFNDIAVAANVALRDYPELISRVLIVDLDVHQGNGCAALFENDPRVFTFSAHCDGNYFSKKEDSDLDVELAEGMDDAAYLAAIEEHLPQLFVELQPQLVFFQAGVDPHVADRFGKLAVSSAGLKRRNKLVYQLAAAHGSRLVVTMGGGYPKDLELTSEPFRAVVQSHMDVYRQLVAMA